MVCKSSFALVFHSLIIFVVVLWCTLELLYLGARLLSSWPDLQVVLTVVFFNVFSCLYVCGPMYSNCIYNAES